MKQDCDSNGEVMAAYSKLAFSDIQPIEPDLDFIGMLEQHRELHSPIDMLRAKYFNLGIPASLLEVTQSNFSGRGLY